MIHAALAWQGVQEAEIARRVQRIGDTVEEILTAALRTARQPEHVAMDRAADILRSAG